MQQACGRKVDVVRRPKRAHIPTGRHDSPPATLFALQDLLSLYTKAGVKGAPVVFLMTDNQIVKEQFLVYINDLLSTGYIADLCTQEDKDNFCNAVGCQGWLLVAGWAGSCVGQLVWTGGGASTARHRQAPSHPLSCPSLPCCRCATRSRPLG